MSSRTETPVLPRYVNLQKFIRQGVEITGVIPFAELGRVRQVLGTDCSGGVDVSIRFGTDEGGHKMAAGQIRATLPVICQRCLQKMDFTVDEGFRWGFVLTDDQARDLPKDLDPALVHDDENMDIYDAIEDELLLNIPIVANHDEGDCSLIQKDFPETLPVDPVEILETKENPFQVLATLREQLKTDKGN